MAPTVSPGPAPNTRDGLEQRIRKLEKRVEELTRKKSYPFSVAPDDNVLFQIAPDPGGAVNEDGSARANVEIGFGDGRPAFLTEPDPFNSALQTAMFLDHEGNDLIRTDGYVGYGLYNPRFTGTFNLRYTGGATRYDLYQPASNNVWRLMYEGYLLAFNPVTQCGLQVEARSTGSTACAAALRLTYKDPDQNVLGVSPNFPVSAAANAWEVANVQHEILLPPEMMTRFLRVEVEVCLTSGANSSNVASANASYIVGAGTYEGWDTD